MNVIQHIKSKYQTEKCKELLQKLSWFDVATNLSDLRNGCLEIYDGVMPTEEHEVSGFNACLDKNNAIYFRAFRKLSDDIKKECLNKEE